MEKKWHKASSGLFRPIVPAASDAVRHLQGWDPFLDVDVVKLGREVEPCFTPTFDVMETAEWYGLVADLPGVREEDLEVTWTTGRIRVAGKREPEALGEGADFYALERTFGRFVRAFTLPPGACVDRTSAVLKNGVLTVVVPKPPLALPMRVPLGDGRARHGQAGPSRGEAAEAPDWDQPA